MKSKKTRTLKRVEHLGDIANTSKTVVDILEGEHHWENSDVDGRMML
jgi:hypothetical protein